jgi:hypothetical protein
MTPVVFESALQMYIKIPMRAGVTVPKSADCERLSELLDVDVAWLCAGQA